MVVYIKNDVPNKFVELDQELDSALYSNIGSTFEDYEAGFWVRLSDSQKDFYYQYPAASVEEVWNKYLQSSIDSDVNQLELAKEDAINTIRQYDLSTAVNAFMVNSQFKTWFTVEQRLNYKQSVEAAKILGEGSLQFLVEGIVFSIPITKAEYMLAQIQRYADKCFLVTEQHKANIKDLTNIEDVHNYDFTVGYPEMLNFVLV